MYRRLVELAGKLQAKRGEPVSIEDAIRHLLLKKEISDLAGSWDLTDGEVAEIKRSLRKGWGAWRKSV